MAIQEQDGMTDSDKEKNLILQFWSSILSTPGQS